MFDLVSVVACAACVLCVSKRISYTATRWIPFVCTNLVCKMIIAGFQDPCTILTHPVTSCIRSNIEWYTSVGVRGFLRRWSFGVRRFLPPFLTRLESSSSLLGWFCSSSQTTTTLARGYCCEQQSQYKNCTFLKDHRRSFVRSFCCKFFNTTPFFLFCIVRFYFFFFLVLLTLDVN